MSIRVLIVDDSLFIRKMISLLLQEHGECEVVGTAADGTQALELIEQLGPDVITVDLDMPGMNGAELIARLRATRTTPVVVVSGLPEAMGPSPGHPDWEPVEYVAKVLSDRPLDLSLFAAELSEKIKSLCAGHQPEPTSTDRDERKGRKRSVK